MSSLNSKHPLTCSAALHRNRKSCRNGNLEAGAITVQNKRRSLDNELAGFISYKVKKGKAIPVTGCGGP
jgi:hypothetical protein